MVYESNYRPARNVYNDELMHYGVPGMKWGRRKSPTAYGGSITKSGKYRASNGVVIARSANKRAAAMRRFGTSAGGRMLSAIGSTGLSAKQKDRMKREQAALKEYYKVGGDKMLKRTSANYDTARAEYKAAKKAYNKSFNKAYNYSSTHLISQYVNKDKKAESDRRWDDVDSKAKALNSAEKAYKKSKADYRRG